MSEPSGSELLSPASVRVRRAQTVSRPSINNAFAGEGDNRQTGQETGDLLAPLPPSQGDTRSSGRQRRATITERLFAEDSPISLPGDAQARARSASRSSAGSQAAQAHSAIVIKVPEPKDGMAEASTNERRKRAGTLSGTTGHRRGLSLSSAGPDHHAQEEVDVLEVLDQKVSTTATLSNIQSAFIPNIFTRAPVVELDAPSPISDEESLPMTPGGKDVVTAVDELDLHLLKLVKQQKRKQKTREVLKGVAAFIKTPVGVFFLIYGVLVVLAGGSLVLMLMIPFNSYRKKLWIEIDSQILTGLFTITSLLPLPWRVLDWINISVIAYYARVTYKRRSRMNLPALRDPNDLPDPADAEYYIGPRGAKIPGKNPNHPSKPMKKPHSGKKREDKPLTQEAAKELVPAEGEEPTTPDDDDEEVVVLTEKEEDRLRRAQAKFAKSQTWYRPHTTPTHHASPIKWAVWYTILMIGNSIFQAALCGVMWGLNRFNRPAAVTGILIPCSFLCGIFAAVLVWQSGVRTKRKAEVTAAVWAMLKADEEKVEADRKALAEAQSSSPKHHVERQPT